MRHDTTPHEHAGTLHIRPYTKPENDKNFGKSKIISAKARFAT